MKKLDEDQRTLVQYLRYWDRVRSDAQYNQINRPHVPDLEKKIKVAESERQNIEKMLGFV